MGIESGREQELRQNAASGPEPDLAQRREKQYLYWFTRIPGFGAVTLRRMRANTVPGEVGGVGVPV